MNVRQFSPTVLSVFSLIGLSALVACGGSYGGGSGSMGMGSMWWRLRWLVHAQRHGEQYGRLVSGMVTLTASAGAQGSNTVSSVQFRVDGVAVGTPITAAPYSYAWSSTSVANGTHQITAVVTDSANQMTTSSPVTLTVTNGSGSFAVSLTADQIFPQPLTTATGSGNFTVDPSNGALSGSITVSGITPLSVEIGDAYAGAQSTAVIMLTMNASNVDEWDVPAGATLNTQQLADLGAGKIYVLVRSATSPNGELRAQLLPSGIVVKFAALTGSRKFRRWPPWRPDRWP